MEINRFWYIFMVSLCYGLGLTVGFYSIVHGLQILMTTIIFFSIMIILELIFGSLK